MKGARDRKPTGGEPRERTSQLLERETQKISASQLAEVLARVDGELESRTDGGLESKPPEPRRTISGTRPIIRPAVRPRSDADPASSSPSEPTEGLDIPVEHLAPIIERPVPEEHVVNATALAVREPQEDEADGPAPATAVAAVATPLRTEPSGEVAALESASDSDLKVPSAEPLRLARRGRLITLVLVMIVLAIGAALVFVYRR